MNQRVASLKKQLALIDEQQKRLTIRAPFDGQVVEWNLREKLKDRPVTSGQVLMEVADPKGDWELELQMPESKMGYVMEEWKKSGGKLPVTFILATHPAEKLAGWVDEIDPSAGSARRGRQHGDVAGRLRPEDAAGNFSGTKDWRRRDGQGGVRAVVDRIRLSARPVRLHPRKILFRIS